MTYFFTWSDNTLKNTTITVTKSVVDTTSTSLTLIGKGYANWGEPLQENMLYLLENFASNGSNPPGNPTFGQAWYDATADRLKVYSAESSSFKELAYRRIDLTTPPPGITYSGDTWYDTVNSVLHVYDTTWKPLAYGVQVQGNYSVSTGTDNYVMTTPVVTSYVNNFVGRFKVAVTNTGACKVDAGAGLIDLETDQGVALQAGDLEAGMIVTFLYVFADSKAYVTSIVKSQLDDGYANIAGNDALTFKVDTAVAGTDATPLAQVNSLVNAVAASGVNDGDAAGGVLSGTYPNPGFAVDMTTQAELNAVVAGLSNVDNTADANKSVNHATTATSLSTATGLAPSYSCRAWVNFNGTGTVFIRASGNVSSITDNGVGDYTVNFTTAMPDVDYSCVSTAGNANGDSTAAPLSNVVPLNVSSFLFGSWQSQYVYTRTDHPLCQAVIFR